MAQNPIKAIGQAAQHANAINFNNAFKWATVYEVSLLVFTFSIAFLLLRKFKTEAYAEL